MPIQLQQQRHSIFQHHGRKRRFVLAQCFLRQPNICICVAKATRRTNTVSIQKITQILWSKIFQRLKSCNPCLCINQLLYGFPPQTFKNRLDSSTIRTISNNFSCPVLKPLQMLNFCSTTSVLEQQYRKCGATMLQSYWH